MAQDYRIWLSLFSKSSLISCQKTFQIKFCLQNGITYETVCVYNKCGTQYSAKFIAQSEKVQFAIGLLITPADGEVCECTYTLNGNIYSVEHLLQREGKEK